MARGAGASGWGGGPGSGGAKGRRDGYAQDFSGVVAIEVTTREGRKLSYRSRQGGFITGIDDARESLASGRMTVPEIAKRMTENGATVKTYTKTQLAAHDEERRKEIANKPDYEMGIGVPWGNKNNRKAARASRLAGRVQRRRR